MAKAVKRTTKKRKSTKRKAVKKAAEVVAELEEQAQLEEDAAASTATAVQTREAETDTAEIEDESLDKVEAELAHVEQVRYFVDFVRGSERGVVR